MSVSLKCNTDPGLLMSKSMRNGCMILTLALVAIGCGKPPPEEKLGKERVAAMEKMADNFEKVTDKASNEAAFKENITLRENLKKVDDALAALGPERRDAAIKANQEPFDAAAKRFESAKKKAAIAANQSK